MDTVDTASTCARPAADSAGDRQSGRTSPIQRLSSTVADLSAPAYLAGVMFLVLAQYENTSWRVPA
ncbi:MAG: hypothetical protein ACXWQ5_24430 [Ktedonobacterales bacterium]